MSTGATSQTLFIDTSKCFGTTSEFYITFPPGAVECGQDESMSLVLERYTTIADWQLINAGMYLQVKDTNAGETNFQRVDLQPGNPTLQDLAAQITATMTLAHPTLRFLCRFDRTNDRFVFTNGNDSQLTLLFPDMRTALLLGFDELTVGPGAILTSWNAINPLLFDSIKIDVTGVRSAQANMSTCATGEVVHDGQSYYDAIGQMEQCNILAAFVVNAAPYTWLEYSNSGDQFTLQIADKQITQLHFRMTDWQGRELTRLTDPQYLQLRVDKTKTLDVNGVLLSNILRTIQLGLLSMEP